METGYGRALKGAGQFPVSNFQFRFSPPTTGGRQADVAQLVEHVLGKDGVSGSIPLIGSRVS